MNDFEHLYVQKCAELSIDPLKAILDNIKEAKNAGNISKNPSTLNLSGLSVPLKSCTALSHSLATNDTIKRLILADAFLGDEGCILIANCLKTNQFLTYLDIRGNSIRCDGAIALGQMLKVNNKLEHLNLEWNCVGIWESGIRALADGLSMNSTLTTLDLRNNKIGPHGAQALALCLKHNTTLHIRWNNAGLIGGRSFVDLLKWNKVLQDLDLTGNELPEDVSQAILTSLESNKSRYMHEFHSKSHSETLAQTLQQLSLSHHLELDKMSGKLENTSIRAHTLSEKLELASDEINRSQDALKKALAKIEHFTNDKESSEDSLTKERSATQQMFAEVQSELIKERQRRMKLEDERDSIHEEHVQKQLELEASFKKIDLEAEMLRRDKMLLLQELTGYKEKEKMINGIWEEKLSRSESDHHLKLSNLRDNLEKEHLIRIKKLEEKNRTLENEKSRLDEDLDGQKQKFIIEKRNLQDRLSDSETRIRNEEKIIKQEMETNIRTLSTQRDSALSDLSLHFKEHHKLIKNHEMEIKELIDKKIHILALNAEFQAQSNHHSSDIMEFTKRLESSKEERKQLQADIDQLKLQLIKKTDQIHNHEKLRSEELDTRTKMVHERDVIINKLKEDLRLLHDELETVDEENQLKMKEMSLNINSILQSRTRSNQRKILKD